MRGTQAAILQNESGIKYFRVDEYKKKRLNRTQSFLLRGRSSIGRASAWHAEGRRFDSDRLHQIFKPNQFTLLRFFCFPADATNAYGKKCAARSIAPQEPQGCKRALVRRMAQELQSAGFGDYLHPRLSNVVHLRRTYSDGQDERKLETKSRKTNFWSFPIGLPPLHSGIKWPFMKNELPTLPSAASLRLESEIRPDEPVLFAGQPVVRGFNELTKTLFLSALFVLIGYPLMLNTFVAELSASWQWIKWLLYTFFVLSIPMCIALMSSPLLLKRLRKQSAFVLTDRRVIVLKALPLYSKIQSFGIGPGIIESVCLHRDGSGDLLLASESGRGWLRDIPRLKQFVTALGRLGVQEPNAEKYAEHTLRAARAGLIKQSLTLATLAIFCLLTNSSVNTDDTLRANGVRTEAKIVGISEEKSLGGRSSRTVYRPHRSLFHAGRPKALAKTWIC